MLLQLEGLDEVAMEYYMTPDVRPSEGVCVRTSGYRSGDMDPRM